MNKLAVVASAVSIFVLSAVAYGQMDCQGMNSKMAEGQGMGCECKMMRGQDRGHEEGEHDHMMAGPLKGIELDDQQKASIRQIETDMMKDNIRREADVRIAGLELKELLSKEPVDMKAVEAKVKQAEALKSAMKLAHIKAFEEIKAKLTPEQRKKLRTMKAAGPMRRGTGMMGMGMMHKCSCGMGKDSE